MKISYRLIIFKMVKIAFLFVFLSIMGLLAISCKSSQTEKEPPRGPRLGDITPSSSSSSNGLYGQVISIPRGASPKVVSLANELADWLKKGTGQTFRVSAGANQGIVLSLTPPATTPAATLSKIKASSRESFYLKSQGNALYISARTEQALSHGVFQYLERLGYRWYFPGEKWTIVPSLKAISIQADQVVVPAFRNRTFFGTGGHGGNKVLDRENNSKKAWNSWAKRNGWGLEYYLPGHQGNAFNGRQKQMMLAHPEYLAEINGKRVPFNTSAKHCYSNKGVTALWAKDRIQDYEEQLRRNPHNYPLASIGIDPSDGGKHCQCKACLKMGSVSNRVFHSANVVAKAAEKKYPDARVHLYAYNYHAAVPDIPLHKNVAVSIIPYAFQNVAPPEVFLEQWSKKVSNMNIYDYWNYTDTRFDKPHFEYSTLHQRVKFWHQQKIEGVTLETSYSIGANGLGLYLASKLLWNPNMDFEGELEEFYRLTFGKAAGPMRRMMERWSLHYHHLEEYELGNAFADLKEAEKLVKDPVKISRINDFKAYVHYLALYHECKNLPEDSKQRAVKVEELFRYVWQINPTYMIHSYRIADISTRVWGKKFPAIRNKYKTTKNDPRPAVWRSIRPISSQEIQRNFNTKKQIYTKEVPVSDYSGKVKQPSKQQARSIPLGGKKEPLAFALVSPHVLQIFNDRPNQDISLEIKAAIPRNGNIPLILNRITFQGPTGKVISRTKFEIDKTWHSYTFSMKTEGLYTLELDVNAIHADFKVPTHIPSAFYKRPRFKTHPKQLYFYVPKDLDKVYFLTQRDFVKIEVTSPNGKEYTIPGGGEPLKVLDIPENERGKVWSYYSYYGQFKILNVPQYFFLSDKYFLPENLIDSQ